MEESSLNKFAENLQDEILKKIRNTYSSVVIDHWQKPRNWGIMNNADGYAKITGPCGDTMEISIKVKDGIIEKCTFDTDGCGTTIACASIATEMAAGKTTNGARRIDQEAILKYCGGLPEEDRHCALLAANTLQNAIDNFLTTKRESWRKLYQ
jgi:nitrogen fixation NifU-like protein